MIIQHKQLLKAADIALSLNLKKTLRGFTGDCPVCGYKGAFSLTEKQGRLLTYCHAGCEASTVFEAVLLSQSVSLKKLPIRPPNNNYAQHLWHQSVASSGTLIETYFQYRGYRGPIPETLRYLDEHPHKPTGNTFPVMLAKVSDQNGCFQAVHRTYLNLDGQGKAPVEPAKMTLGSIRGGAIRLCEATDQVILCEGIETGLALIQETRIPVWSCISAGGLKTVNLPPSIQGVIIAADYDQPGLQAADEAAKRFYKHGLTVKIIKPQLLNTDFADELLKKGRI